LGNEVFQVGLIAGCLLGEPVLSPLLAWWLFNETLTWGKAADGALIAGFTWRRRRINLSGPQVRE